MKNSTPCGTSLLSDLVFRLSIIADTNISQVGSNRVLEINGRAFEFEGDTENEDVFFVKCHVCSLPKEKKEKLALLQAALEFNFEFYDGWSPVLVLVEDKNEVVSLTSFSFAQVTPEKLFTKMQCYSEALELMSCQLEKKVSVIVAAGKNPEGSSSLLQARLLGGLS